MAVDSNEGGGDAEAARVDGCACGTEAETDREGEAEPEAGALGLREGGEDLVAEAWGVGVPGRCSCS